VQQIGELGWRKKVTTPQLTECLSKSLQNEFLQQAIDLAKKSLNAQGGPFGAVVVRNSEVIAEGNNRVTMDNDPTAHAEIVAIRRACEVLKTFLLSDCVLIASSEPCPMCLSAIYWSRIPIVYYANSCEIAHKSGFDDDFIYQELAISHPQKKIVLQQAEDDTILKSGAEIFKLWNSKKNKISY